jgi:hypothetical protein
MNGAPRVSPWSPLKHTRLRQGSRLPKNLFGEQVGGSSAPQRNPPKYDTCGAALLSG